MSKIYSVYLLQRSDDGILFLTLCVRDGYPHGRRPLAGSVAGAGRNGVLSESPMRVALQYSPTRRDDFVKCDSAGARPKNFQTLNGYEQGLFGMEGRGLRRPPRERSVVKVVDCSRCKCWHIPRIRGTR
jgi:hypothetical protein